MTATTPVPRPQVAGLIAATGLGLLYALTALPGFLPLFAVAVLATVLSHRRAMVLPGSLFVCFFTLLMLLAPYLDLRFDVLTRRVTSLYAYWPEDHLLLGIVALIEVMLVVHVLTVDERSVRRMHLALRRVPPIQLLAVALLGIACEIALFLLGAGRHTAGFNDIPFVGVLNVIKTLPELLVAVAAFAIARSPRRRVYALVIVVILADSLVTSLLSGRKEDLLTSVTMTLVGFWSSVRHPVRFLLKTVAPVLAVTLVFLPFMYRLRAHPAFNRMDQTATPMEIIGDTISGKYADRDNPSNFLQRLDLLEPTARYFGKRTVPMYDPPDLWVLLACSVIPRFLWPDKPAEQPSLGYRFAVHYGYASDAGITSIAFGYLVELHFLFGWWGLALLIALPWALSSGPTLALLAHGRVLPLFEIWVLYKFAVFVERTLVIGAIETAPYVLLAFAVEGGWAGARALTRRRLFPRAFAGARPAAVERIVVEHG